VLQILGRTVPTRTAAAAAVLEPELGSFWAVLADLICPILLLFWQQNWGVFGPVLVVFLGTIQQAG